MQHVATVPLQVAGEDGTVRSVFPGQAVPEFATWDYPAQLAHRRLGWVVDEEGVAAEPVAAAAAPSEEPPAAAVLPELPHARPRARGPAPRRAAD